MDMRSSNVVDVSQSDPPQRVVDVCPLSPLQEGILFHCLLNRNSDAYVFSTLFEFDSRAHLLQWISAVNEVIGRHDILRTSIRWEGLPRPVQVVAEVAALSVEELTLDEGQDAVEYLQSRMRPGHQPRIDLREAPLARLLVARGADGRQYGLLALHHLISDWGSLQLLIDESLYYLEHHEQDLPPLQPYKEYVAYTLAHAHADGAEEFFNSRLADVEDPTTPFGLFEPHGESVELEEASLLIGRSVARKIRSQASRHGVTPARLFHAAWALVVGCTSGKDDVVFGTVLSARQSRSSLQLPETMGLLVNTLPLRVRIADLTANELVQHTHQGLGELLEHVHTPLTTAQRCSGIRGGGPLFTAIISYRHGTHEIERHSRSGVRILGRSEAPTGYPVSLCIDDRGNEFLIAAQTDRRIPAARVVQYVETAIQSLVHALEERPDTPAARLAILPEKERYAVVELFNATEAAYPREKLIHELFEEQVERTPHAVAVIYEDQSLTYAEVNARANQWARYLTEQGVTPGQLIPILMPRSLQMLIAQLAVLKSGAAYVPIDPEFPIERQAFILRDCGARCVLAERGDRRGWSTRGCAGSTARPSLRPSGRFPRTISN